MQTVAARQKIAYNKHVERLTQGSTMQVLPQPTSIVLKKPTSTPPTSTTSTSTITPLDEAYPINNLYFEKYKSILTGMFNKRPSGENRDSKIDVRSWMNFPENGIPMKDFVKPFKRSCKENNFPTYLLECQPIGGFKVEIPGEDGINYLTTGYGNPTKIFDRFAKIASNNLVAISEAGSLLADKYDPLMLDRLNLISPFKDKDIKDCLLHEEQNKDVTNKNITFNDTGFVCGVFNSNDKKDTTTTLSSIKFMDSNNIIILNCHLDSKGPNKFDDKKNPIGWKLKVNKFIQDQFQLHSTGKSPDVIVGDTNITISKTKNGSEQITRKELLECILNEINERYNPNNENDPNKCWVLITSSVKINKIRSGFLLLNNQMYKANKKEIVEEDGTIIAIRINKDKLSELTLDFCNSNFSKNWHMCYHDSGEMYIHKNNLPETESIVNFLQFTDLDKCTNESGMPLDDIFIDHSVLAVSKHAILTLTQSTPTPLTPTNITEKSQPSWNNLVVLNLGSIINSNNPWILELLNKDILPKIRIADDQLFSQMIVKLTDNDFKYDDYQGEIFGEFVFKQEVGIIDTFAKSMTRVHMYLETQISSIFPKTVIKAGYLKTRKIKKYKTKKIKRKLKNKTTNTISRKMNKRKTYKY
jgi:hypothetical protein